MVADVAARLGDLMPDVFRAIDLTGVFLNGVLGGLIGRRRGFDIVGFAILAIVSALGGGMLRDTLLQAGPPVALTDPAYLGTALAGALVAFLLHLRGRWWNRVVLVADALVLGAWAATGASKALTAGLGVMPAIMLGVTTAVGGGIIRDVAVGEVPAVFGGNTLYATSAIFASGALIVLHSQGHETLGMVAAIVVGAGLSILARWRRWILPDAETVRTAAPRLGLRRRDEVRALRPRRRSGRDGRRRRRLPGEPG
ncbi:trimeric intracellular cation channel family protein [Georgenia sp. TF02-10]|uniref:trimeric intracellular cation channel family protein n=1 Tax=Georgenia sp. TF02-10 TaxID=2917725 RepID=UPI001FA6EB9D|nr:trimeric intracellular cation channel family protein [Georgenia sp. TF02-10]UNX55065.1 trimeric intracellular cation channel family protein [Georgenia sp. TF02-10]